MSKYREENIQRNGFINVYNYTLNHLLERLKIYNEQKFDYYIKKFTL